jgi:hypothetical protein
MIETGRPDVTIIYALQRYVLHIFHSPAFYLLSVAVFYWLVRKFHWRRMQGWWALIAPAVFIFIFISGREIWDVSAGDPVWKSITDWSSWITGLGLTVWGVYRLTPLFNDILGEIKLQPSNLVFKGNKPVTPSISKEKKEIDWTCQECATINRSDEWAWLYGTVVCSNCKHTFTRL